jgi:internalin A
MDLGKTKSQLTAIVKNLLITGSAFLTLVFATPVTAQPKSTTSFAQWCQQKSTLPASTKLTIDVLLKKAGTQNCKTADRHLKSLTELILENNQISDLQPLSGLANLTSLDVDNNRIRDLQPLSGLTNLKHLAASKNQISTLKPLAGLTSLASLRVERNQISDLQPLSGLTDLRSIAVGKNQISSLKPLTGLTNLTALFSLDNKISDLTPLRELTKLELIELSTNQISDLTPLSGLINLTFLSLSSNQISDLTPISELTNLTVLGLNKNQIVDVKPLARLNKLSILLLSDNKIADMKPLSGLNKLLTLSLKNNPLSEKICPIEASRCEFSDTPQAQANLPTPTKKLLRTLEVPSRVRLAALSRDRQTLVTAQEDKITVWNLASGASRTYTLLDSRYATISALTISPDGRTLITGSSGMDTKESANVSGCSGFSCESSQTSSRTKSQYGSAIQFWELSTGKGTGMLALSQRESLLFGLVGYDRLEFSTDGKTFFSHSKNETRQEMIGWEYPSWTRKTDAKSQYKSIKPSSVIDISRNGNNSKIDIYTID